MARYRVLFWSLKRKFLSYPLKINNLSQNQNIKQGRIKVTFVYYCCCCKFILGFNALVKGCLTRQSRQWKKLGIAVKYFADPLLDIG